MNNPHAMYIYCDGAMDYDSKNSGGIGFNITFPDALALDPIPISIGRYIGGNIEVLELEALISAMKETIEVFKKHNDKLGTISQIIFITDRYGLREDDKTSPYRIAQYRSNRWRNHEGKPIKNHKLLDELDKTRNKLSKLARSRVTIEFRPSKKNRVADKLSKRAKTQGFTITKLAKKGEKIGKRKYKGSEVTYSYLKANILLHVNIFRKDPVQEEWEVWAEICDGIYSSLKLKIYTDDILAKKLKRGNEFIVEVKTVFNHHIHIYDNIREVKGAIEDSDEILPS